MSGIGGRIGGRKAISVAVPGPFEGVKGVTLTDSQAKTLAALMQGVAAANRWPGALESLQRLVSYAPDGTTPDVFACVHDLQVLAPALVRFLTDEPVDESYPYTPKRPETAFQVGDRVKHVHYEEGTVIPEPKEHHVEGKGWVWVLTATQWAPSLKRAQVVACRPDSLVRIRRDGHNG